MSYLSWHVGMKIVCVDAGNRDYSPWPSSDKSLDGLTQGKTYTIRRIGDYYGTICVWLEEIVRPRRGRDWNGALPEEAGFAPQRFRPVQTRKTDIAIFTAMLDGTKSKVPA